jgi:hypothetical protein
VDPDCSKRSKPNRPVSVCVCWREDSDSMKDLFDFVYHPICFSIALLPNTTWPIDELFKYSTNLLLLSNNFLDLICQFSFRRDSQRGGVDLGTCVSSDRTFTVEGRVTYVLLYRAKEIVHRSAWARRCFVVLKWVCGEEKGIRDWEIGRCR